MTATRTRDQIHPENPWAGSGSVLLDIGGDVGALVVTMPEGLEGREVEIRPAAYVAPADRSVHHPHVAVVHRPVGSRRVPSLVFPGLSEGAYELYEKGTDVLRLAVHVRGGRVTEARWPG
ncbi:MAG TPA: hypothetical protein VFH10_08715 [Nocardioides sp.]|uniref:hypothetical protein n=1 Tax=Nocardioides sp. TaxID=35761 RepID=UPI002D7FDB9E|nr:hypothetical protein [Nocardioides sp.]HET6652709.1 hypothetical protein [Nocardioides sp.]